MPAEMWLARLHDSQRVSWIGHRKLEWRPKRQSNKADNVQSTTVSEEHAKTFWRSCKQVNLFERVQELMQHAFTLLGASPLVTWKKTLTEPSLPLQPRLGLGRCLGKWFLIIFLIRHLVVWVVVNYCVMLLCFLFVFFLFLPFLRVATFLGASARRFSSPLTYRWDTGSCYMLVLRLREDVARQFFTWRWSDTCRTNWWKSHWKSAKLLPSAKLFRLASFLVL